MESIIEFVGKKFSREDGGIFSHADRERRQGILHLESLISLSRRP